MHGVIAAAAVSALAGTAPGQIDQRVLGVDISYWNCGTSSDGISQSNWNTGFSTGNRKFAWIRATRGGTTGVDEPQGTPGGGSLSTLSRRYDDSRFIQNITRATAAGMYAGPYHFGRPDIAGNTGTDEANHFIQMAAAFMRPGYMLPVFDLEAGTSNLGAFSLDFSNRLYAVMQIRPAMYINGNHTSHLVNSSTASQLQQIAQPAAQGWSMVSPAYPMLWNARYSDNDNPNSIPVQTGNPKQTYTTVSSYYGPWDDYGDLQPWSFWQYASTVSVPGFSAVDGTIDGNVSQGDIEYVRNYLVPAVWWNDSSGDWGTLLNWNSGQPVVAPVTPSDQATPYATGPLPTPRLPGAAGSGATSGQYDTVILERPSANITVTHSAGTTNIRKLYMREALNITGGSLTINYDPTYRENNLANVLHGGPYSARFSGPVSLSGGSLTLHTAQLDSAQTLTLSGGTFTFNTLNMISNSATKVLVSGDAAINPRNNATATIKRSASSGSIDLTGGTRVLTIGNGTAAVDVSFDVPVVNGSLTKSGAGTLQLSATNTYTGATNVNQGVLNLTGTTHASSVMNVNSGGSLAGTGTVNGNATLNGTGSINFSGTGKINAALTVNGGAWNGAGSVGGTVTVQSGTFTVSGSSLTAGAIVVDPGSTMTLLSFGGGGNKIIRAGSVTPNGKLDLRGHKMIVDYSASSPIGVWNGTAYDGLTRNIIDGRNGGTWDGNGIVTSMPDAQGAANMKATIGITEASQALGLSAGQTGTWRGQSVDSTTVLLAYAYQGDADLSGAIDSDDFFQIDAGHLAGASGFGRGDFNYDGRIDADDYFLINANYGKQLPQLVGAPAVDGLTSVPEPSGFAVVGALAVGLLRRRRKFPVAARARLILTPLPVLREMRGEGSAQVAPIG